MFQSHRRLTTLAVATLMVVGFGRAAPAGAADLMDVDESRIDALARSVSEDRSTFGGMSIDNDGNVIVRYTGAIGRIAARAKLAGHTGVNVDRGKRGKLRLVEVKHSMKELDAVREQIKTDTALKPVISRYFVDVQRNVVSVGVTEITPQVRQAVKDRFGARVEVHVAARAQRLSRIDDTQPWDGGIRITRLFGSGGTCTGGYVVRSASVFNPTRQLVTAGHCGSTGSTWYNGLTSVGSRAYSRRTDFGYDYARIGGSTYVARTYTDLVTSNTTRAVAGSDTPVRGRKYCTNGATTGQVCWGTVVNQEACVMFQDGITTCHLDVLRPDYGQVMAAKGDSGGAVITYTGSRVLIAGIIIGGSIHTNEVYFHSHNTLFPSGPFSNWVLDTSV